MRKIRYFVVTQTKVQYPNIIKESFERELIYPAPHYYVFKVDQSNDAEKNQAVKMRPLSERCGTVRDSLLNNNGVGILVYNPEGGNLSEDMKQCVATAIKNIVDDFGIIQYQIVTDEISKEAFVDTLDIPALVANTPSIFIKREIT